MEALMPFKSTVATLGMVFLYYGMDVRHKAGACYFVAPHWQWLMKVCSFALIAGFMWVAFSANQISMTDWLSLAPVAAGTFCIVAAKRALGSAHTFTGQYLEQSGLVMHGIYALTRNPLYFGVSLCEVGASIFVLRQAPALLPQTYGYWLCAFATALLYAMAFNWNMAHKEARFLEEHFGDTYRRYQSRVPFLIPSISLAKEHE